MPTDEPAGEVAGTIGAIDIGSNAIRMEVAQALADGRIETLERTQQAVHLGQDSFVEGRLGQPTINAAVAVLRDYRRILDTYGVTTVRAVATSAVREAANADAFIDRVYMATGIDLEVIVPSEESRLTVGAVLAEVGDDHELWRRDGLIVDVGGGSTLLTFLHHGQIAASGSYRLGSIRLQEMLRTSQEPADRAAEMLRNAVATTVPQIRAAMPVKKARTLIALGGDARFTARHIGTAGGTKAFTRVERKAFDAFVEDCAGHPAEALARRYGLPFADAETLVAALLVYQAILRATQAKDLLVSEVSMRDGLLLELARQVRGESDDVLAESVIESARGIGEKYRHDAAHAEHVADLAVRVFDATQEEHRLNARKRLLLKVAALLHDVGTFISARAHHKHSFYLVSNAEVFGLRQEEQAIVSHVARYHRRSPPKPSHTEYMSLSRETRMVVTKLAAILRVADALDRDHSQQVRDVRFEHRAGAFVILVRGAGDLTLERRALAAKSDLFTDIYGMTVRLEETDR